MLFNKNLLRIYIGFEPKSENRFYVWSCNFWSRIDTWILTVTFFRHGMGEQIWRKIFSKIYCKMLIFPLKNRPNQVYTTFPENPDMAGVQIAIKHAKIVENSKFKKIEKWILELPFGGGFIKIHQPARFVQHFEISSIFACFIALWKKITNVTNLYRILTHVVQ